MTNLPSPETARAFTRLTIAFAVCKLLIHLLTNTNYTFHRDEFLYIDEGNHLAWGFLEVPPLTPFLGKMVTLIAGDGVFGVRLLPALVGVAMIFFIARIVRELRGGVWALALACTAFITSLAFLRTNTLFQPVCLDQLWWVVVLLYSIRIVKYGNTRDYLVFGIAGGLGWLTKYSIAFIAIAVLLALLITPQRKTLSAGKLTLSAAIAFFIALPNVIWQYQHNFPLIQHMHELSETQLVHVNPMDFLISQVLMQFAGILIWLPGVVWLIFSKRSREYRFLGWTYVFLIGLMLVLRGKGYYTLGIYPVMMAAGGVALEQWITSKAGRSVMIGLVFFLNLPLLPMGLPLLSVENMIRYCKVLEKAGIEQRWEDGKKYPIPQDYADMYAWEEPVATVAKRYHALTPSEQATCLIFGGNYAHAGPLNYYREKYGLPVAHSLNATYILWIPDSINFDRMLIVEDSWDESSPLFSSVEFIDSTRHPYARDPGYVYYLTDPKPGKDSLARKFIADAKLRFKREAKGRTPPKGRPASGWQ